MVITKMATIKIDTSHTQYACDNSCCFYRASFLGSKINRFYILIENPGTRSSITENIWRQRSNGITGKVKSLYTAAGTKFVQLIYKFLRTGMWCRIQVKRLCRDSFFRHIHSEDLCLCCT